MNSVKPVYKAIIPVTGLGTRMLPATKAIPKKLLPINYRPLIEHVVKEAVEGGITEKNINSFETIPLRSLIEKTASKDAPYN